MRILLIILILPLQMFANDVKLDELALVDDHTLSAKLSWDNSWKYNLDSPPANHDGVWVFCKGRSASDGKWQHINIESVGAISHPEVEAVLSEDGLGAIFRRAVDGEGSTGEIGFDVQLDIPSADAFIEFRLFAVEMVYVSPGSFNLGDSASNNTLIHYSSGRAYYVENEDYINVGESEGYLYSNENFPPFDDIPSQFPKGFDGFYCMKYEISQEQYADFLNTIDAGQQAANKLSTIIEAPCFSGDHLDGERNYIRLSEGVYGCDANDNGIFNEEDDGQNVACNFLTWSQFTAYLDWSGMRPMSELEFEKACRGPEEPLANELAFGSDKTINTFYPTALNSEQETVADTIPDGFGISNFGYCLPSGPLRCGFAAGASTDRERSGATYYGCMEMSGNLWELCVPLSEAGLQFDGRHGDGNLDVDGHSNVANWLVGGHRGGGWNSGVQDGFRDVAISDRFFIYLDPNDQARGTVGGRGLISAQRFE